MNSLSVDSEGEVDADHCAKESNLTLELSKSDYSDDRNNSREPTPSPRAILEYEDRDTDSTPQDEDLESEDETDRGKPEQWTSYSESENIEFCSSPEQSDSDVEEAFSHEPRELFTIYECDEDVEDDQQYDEPAEANSPESQQLSPLHQSHLEFCSDHRNDEPFEAESPEPRRLSQFRLESPVPEHDDDEKDDELFETESPAPRRLFPVHQSHSTLYNPPQPAPQVENFCPGPLRRFLEPEEMLKFDAFNDWFVHMHMNRHTAIDTNTERSTSATPSPEPHRLFPFRHTSPVPKYGDDEKDDGPFRAESPTPRRLFPVHQSHSTIDTSPAKSIRLFPFRHTSPVPVYDNDEKHDEPVEADSPAPRRLFPAHQSHSMLYDPPQSAPQVETFCPALLRRLLEPEEMLKFDAFEDWFVRMSGRSAIDASPEPRRLFSLRHESPTRDYDDDEKEDDPSEAESPAPRRLFPVHQPHSEVYDSPQSAPQMENFCPAPLRRFLGPGERLKFDAFNDWFVNMHMSRYTAIDASPEKSISEAPSPEPHRLFPFQHTPHVPAYDEEEKDDEPVKADSPVPRRLFPANQSLSTVYVRPKSVPQMETFCAAPLRRFLEPGERIKLDAFEDWFVRRHMSKHTALDASPEPRRLSPLQYESTVPKCANNENYHESFEAESPGPQRFFSVQQSQSWLNEPISVLECDDQEFERMEFIPVESLRV